MPIQVIMPQLGESVVEGTISKWLKGQGDKVEEFEPLLEVNTDKVDSEIPSPASGTVLEILVPEGETVTAGTALALIAEAEETLSGGNGSPGAQASPNNTEPAPQTVQTSPGIAGPGRMRGLGFISPVVAKIASEQGLDLSKISGTGQGGRITKKDVLAYLDSGREAEPKKEAQAAHAAAATEPAEPTPYPRPAPLAIPGELLPHTIVRRAIAEHMVMSKHTSPHVTTVMEVDLSQVVAHRQTHKETFARDGANLTYTAYFVASAVAALKDYPVVNSSWSENGILIHREINVGMATSLGEAGLIVPVIHHADGLSLLGIARAVNDLANRARARQLKPDEVKGGTFTITNHGISGSLIATPIINQPQCGILGVGAIQKRVVVVSDGGSSLAHAGGMWEGGDAIAIRPMVYISLTFDHRILDGAIADYFLAKVVESLQNWK
ncbi:MAG TPA: dihydrolipoamide acetyltransferase family protein [Anaerolineales bacterium]|nr:dihydrolipoamide acetyltransferase family protein [Anaerolineales bacterium]